jgi:8-amino-7-oxononanoate synthase
MQDKPDFTLLSGPLGPRIEKYRQSYLYFGGTAYLGIPQNEAFLKLYLEGIKRYGLNNGTSRSNNVQLSIYNEVEAYAAVKFGASATLITSSGFLAAQFAIKCAEGKGVIRYGPATHPALWKNEMPIVEESFSLWAEKVMNEINSSKEKNWVLISNSMNNLYPEVYDFSFVNQLHRDKQVILLIDDSHGIGINNNGLSAMSSFSAPENVSILLVASMAKALGVDAGIIMGKESLVNEIRNSNGFLGASPPAAAGLFAFRNAEEIYQQELKKLHSLIDLLTDQLVGNNNWHFVPGFPVFLSKNVDLSANLFEKQILVSSFPYPDHDGPIINRVVLSSWHTETDVKTLITSID